jgi:hypothetical protein
VAVVLEGGRRNLASSPRGSRSTLDGRVRVTAHHGEAQALTVHAAPNIGSAI